MVSPDCAVCRLSIWCGYIVFQYGVDNTSADELFLDQCDICHDYVGRQSALLFWWRQDLCSTLLTQMVQAISLLNNQAWQSVASLVWRHLRVTVYDGGGLLAPVEVSIISARMHWKVSAGSTATAFGWKVILFCFFFFLFFLLLISKFVTFDASCGDQDLL